MDNIENYNNYQKEKQSVSTFVFRFAIVMAVFFGTIYFTTAGNYQYTTPPLCKFEANGTYFCGNTSINGTEISADVFSTSQGGSGPYSYLIYTDGVTVYAKNGSTGKVDYSGTPASVLQSMAEQNATGMVIRVRANTYDLGGVTINFNKTYNRYAFISEPGTRFSTTTNATLINISGASQYAHFVFGDLIGGYNLPSNTTTNTSITIIPPGTSSNAFVLNTVEILGKLDNCGIGIDFNTSVGSIAQNEVFINDIGTKCTQGVLVNGTGTHLFEGNDIHINYLRHSGGSGIGIQDGSSSWNVTDVNTWHINSIDAAVSGAVSANSVGMLTYGYYNKYYIGSTVGFTATGSTAISATSSSHNNLFEIPYNGGDVPFNDLGSNNIKILPYTSTQLNLTQMQIKNKILFTGGSAFDVTTQGGIIELGPSNSAGAETPFIDLHYGDGVAEDYNVRYINNANRTFLIRTLEGGIIQGNNTELKALRQFVLTTTTPTTSISNGTIFWNGSYLCVYSDATTKKCAQFTTTV